MGQIKPEVRDNHFQFYPEELDIIKPFVAGFYINWAKRYSFPDISVFLLNPENFMKESYGFSKQVLLAYSPYKNMETRTLDFVDKLIGSDELKEKGIETYCYILISDDPLIETWLQQNIERQDNRIIVPLNKDACIKNKDDDFFIRNILNVKYFGRDLFDYRLPLIDDSYFFGRRTVINSLYDSSKNGKNNGIFGLRKTGKTSLLYKIKRLVESQKEGVVLIYDCKTPSIRKLRWFQLYEKIISEIVKQYNINGIKDQVSEINVSDIFHYVLDKVPKNQKIILVFDEIEWISFLTKKDIHWKSEYLDFWQTFWSAQSLHRNLTTIIAGVNPTINEVDIVDGVQNPLFGIISNVYLAGLQIDDIKEMLKSIGKRMGLHFDTDAIHYIFERYGGHPLLTRLSASLMNTSIKIENQVRPFTIKKDKLIRDEEWRDSELSFYCKHIVSELNEFYYDEYVLLEYLASGQKYEFLEFAQYPEFIKHLESYGLLNYDKNKMPKISIPAVERYIGIELAKKDNRKTIYKVIEPNMRGNWVKKRITSIMTDIKFLEKLIQQKNTLSLFGVNSYPESDKLAAINTSQNEADFTSFINIVNRCFVESIQAYGNFISKSQYYWIDIKNTYPSLFYSLQRIKLYRNNVDHLKLDNQNITGLMEYLNTDLEGRNPSKVIDLFFVLQQCTLDSLLASIQVEINNLS